MVERNPLPYDSKLDIRPLTRIFSHTTTTYKFYWFLALLRIISESRTFRIDARRVVILMIAIAWYPINFFRLNFGPSDRLGQLITLLRGNYYIEANVNVNQLVDCLSDLIISDTTFLKWVRSFLRFVPFRFLSPWINDSDDTALAARSLSYENNCPYRVYKIASELTIEINPSWIQYLQDNVKLLQDFAFWNLTQYLQLRNPNVPNISSKLIQPLERRSLSKQKNFWNFVMTHGLDVKCIYTDHPLQPGNYDLDHFIPWSYVTHDLLWDLIPADPSINSSKSDKIPDIGFLPKLALNQQRAISNYLKQGKNLRILDDYLSLGKSAQDIAAMNEGQLIECYRNAFEPMEQIAKNMGFEPWSQRPLTLF